MGACASIVFLAVYLIFGTAVAWLYICAACFGNFKAFWVEAIVVTLIWPILLFMVFCMVVYEAIINK